MIVLRADDIHRLLNMNGKPSNMSVDEAWIKISGKILPESFEVAEGETEKCISFGQFLLFATTSLNEEEMKAVAVQFNVVSIINQIGGSTVGKKPNR